MSKRHEFGTGPAPRWGTVSESARWETEGTIFGVTLRPSTLRSPQGEFSLGEEMYFAVPEYAELRSGEALFIDAAHHRGVFALGGPAETRGRLRYIDGCTDSLLIGPPVLGDPCLNLLHLPPGTRQSEHFHPSLRLGVVLSGEGQCIMPSENVRLRKGDIFCIHAGTRHSFHPAEDTHLRVIAYHPDTDTGPTHENHPMVNRTWFEDRAQ